MPITTNPTSSFSSFVLGLKVIFVVTLNSSAGNFCKRRLGTSQRLFAPSGILSVNKRRDPFCVFMNDQVAFALACHCHWKPSGPVLNSSLSNGVATAIGFPTDG